MDDANKKARDDLKSRMHDSVDFFIDNLPTMLSVEDIDEVSVKFTVSELFTDDDGNESYDLVVRTTRVESGL